MPSFPFRINASFREYPSHPITIPEACVRQAGKALAVSVRTVTVHALGGPVLTGRVVRSRAGWGPYSQLHIRGMRGDALSALPVGTIVIIALRMVGDMLVVEIDERTAA